MAGLKKHAASSDSDPSVTAPTPGGSLAPRTSMLPAQHYEQRVEMYRLAFDESVRALKDQNDELSGIRQKVVSYLSFVGAAVAFLVGSTLHVLDRDVWFYTLAIAGTALMGVTIIATADLLRPGFVNFGTTSSAQKIIYEMIEPEISPYRNVGELCRDLALYNDQEVDLNEKTLLKLRRVYLTAVISGAVQLAIWIALVWLRG